MADRGRAGTGEVATLRVHRAKETDLSNLQRSKPIPTLDAHGQDRLWSKVEVHHPAGCWEWIGKSDPRGYGVFTIKSKSFLAHRVAYTTLIGPIPQGMCLDHLCRNHSCVNPDHLRVVSERENLLAGYGFGAKRARQTLCKNGHPLSGQNLWVYQRKGSGLRRVCVTCHRKNCREYQSRRRQMTRGFRVEQ